jgi:RNA polymerase sigma factor (sigma-70 family)
METRTSVTLLEKLRKTPVDAAAWEVFVDRYGPIILGWCRKWGLQEADALDVSQMVLATLAATMRTFDYDPARSFRGWLRTLAHHAWRDLVERSKRPGLGSGDPRVLEMLETTAARDDLLGILEAEHEREVLKEAMDRVERRVQPKSWSAFRLLAIEGRPGAAVADKLGMTVAAAFMARSRVQAMLRGEVAAMLGDDGES